MRRLPPVGAIQAFVQVARLGSLKAAADSLSLSPPALTRRIQALEHFLGGALLSRLNNSVQLNARGQEFLEEVEPHIAGLAAAVSRVSHDDSSMRIRIAVPSLFASQRLMPALRHLRERHPNLMIDVDTGANRISRLEDGLDAVIAITETVDPKYYAKVIERSRIIAIGSSRSVNGAPIRGIKDLGHAQILLHREMPKAFDEWRRAVGAPHLQPAGTSYYDAGQLILDAASQGLGIAFMLQSHLASSSDPGLKQFFDQAADSPYAYWFISSHAALRHRPVKLFHDWLFENFAA